MQWSRPRDREYRVRTKFAWLPVRCDNGVIVWLETYTVGERYVRCDPWDYWEAVERTARRVA